MSLAKKGLYKVVWDKGITKDAVKVTCIVCLWHSTRNRIHKMNTRQQNQKKSSKDLRFPGYKETIGETRILLIIQIHI
jgi:hypothetical protein